MTWDEALSLTKYLPLPWIGFGVVLGVALSVTVVAVALAVVTFESPPCFPDWAADIREQYHDVAWRRTNDDRNPM